MLLLTLSASQLDRSMRGFTTIKGQPIIRRQQASTTRNITETTESFHQRRHTLNGTRSLSWCVSAGRLGAELETRIPGGSFKLKGTDLPSTSLTCPGTRKENLLHVQANSGHPRVHEESFRLVSFIATLSPTSSPCFQKSNANWHKTRTCPYPTLRKT